ncbi:MAG: thioredoxin domain-containing protein [Candidatus Omnitrophica bacterium]|nr:thioredoxin domain-containing protein [Candidatus Omnitrophota bacterium]
MKKTLFGLICGVLGTLLVWGLTQHKVPSAQPAVIAKIKGAELSYAKLRQMAASELTPIENDEYAVLKQITDQWVQDTLIQKEMTAQKLTREKLFQKEVWANANVTYSEMTEYYNQNQELFRGRTFDQVREEISQQLRNRAYVKAKDDYFSSLKKKYGLDIYLKKPDSYVQGLAVAPAGSHGAGIADDRPQFKTGKERIQQQYIPKPAEPAPQPVQPPPAPAPAQDNLQNYEKGLDSRPSKGPKDAPVTMIEYSDFHCPFCSRLAPTLDQVMKKYEGKVRLIWRHYPLSFHQGSHRAHEAAECANEQGKFWPFYDELFKDTASAKSDEGLQNLASKLGLNRKAFDACLMSERNKDVVDRDIASAEGTGVRGTPSLLINGKLVVGANPLETYEKMIDELLGAPSAGQDQAAGDKSGFDDLNGRPSKGPADAPVTMVTFSDFHCPFCSRLAPTLEKVVEKYPGKVRLVFRHFPLSFHAGSDQTHAATECANEQSKFWQFHDILFADMKADRSAAGLKAIAQKAGLDMSKFDVCVSSNRNKSVVDADIAAGTKAGVRGTPATFVNGYLVSGAQGIEKFEQVVDTILKTGKPPAADVPAPAPAAPKNVEFDDLAGRPVKGPANAAITMVEFSDFHCPFCGRLAPTLDKVLEKYPDKVKLVFRHNPLSFHTGADKTHAASECAHEQGKFWPFHDILFGDMGADRSETGLRTIAQKAGLDLKKFDACVTSNKNKGVVDKDLAAGVKAGVRGTPATFVNGYLVSGAQGIEKFEDVIQTILKTGKPPASDAPAAEAPAKDVEFNDLKGHPSKGPANAPITIVEFSDYHCPFCQRLEPTIDEVMKKYPEQVRVVFRHNPLPFHTGSDKTHEAAECAHAQGKFWEYHKALFADMKANRDIPGLIGLAKKLGLNESKFETCLKQDQKKQIVQDDLAAGAKAGVRGTPTVFINGRLVSGARPLADFEAVIQEKLKKA